MPHDHDHPHETRPDAPDHLTYYQAMEVAVRELLIEKGVVTADAVRRQVEDMDGRNAGMGAKMVARAWADPAYKQRMLTDGNAAAEEVGLDRGCTNSSSWRIRHRSTTSSYARSAHAIRAGCSDCPPTGTRAGATAAAWCASRGRCWVSSASSCPTT